MLKKPKYIIPNIRTFKIENIERIKSSLFNKKSKLEINRLFIPNDSNNEQIKDSIINIPTILDKTNLNQEFFQTSSSKPQSIINTINQSKIDLLTYNHEEQDQLTSTISRDLLSDEKSSTKNTNKIDILSPVIRVEQSLTPSFSQPIPDSIINDKQTTNRISNETNSTRFTHPSKFITLTPINSTENKTLKLIHNDLSSSSSSSFNHIRYYQIGSIFTSTSTFIMHQNQILAHTNTSDRFLSDTIFIILIATLTVIILLFCLGLFCLCRRSTKRNISPSFDGSSYTELNGQSYEMPMNNYQSPQLQLNSKYENNIPYINDASPTSIPIKSLVNPNDKQIALKKSPVILHQTIKQKMPINNKKYKKKRAGFCCCKSKQTPSTTVNARTRI